MLKKIFKSLFKNFVSFMFITNSRSNDVFLLFDRNKNTRVAERNRKSGKDALGLSDDTLRKLSALLWYNGNDNCGSSDYGVKTNDARSSSDQHENVHLKEANADNINNVEVLACSC